MGMALTLYISFASPRFMPSVVWLEQSWPFYGPVLLAINAAIVWGFLELSDELHARRVKKALARGKSAPRNRITPQNAVSFVFLGPVFMWWTTVPFVTHATPMALLYLASEEMSVEYRITSVDRTAKRGRFIELHGMCFFHCELLRPPSDVWESAKEGDTLVLHGRGNDFGIWFESISVVSTEQD